MNVKTIVFKPDPVVDPVSWSGPGSDGLTRVNPGQPKKNPYYIHLINNKTNI
jgi:hypothetical protein